MLSGILLTLGVLSVLGGLAYLTLIGLACLMGTPDSIRKETALSSTAVLIGGSLIYLALQN